MRGSRWSLAVVAAFAMMALAACGAFTGSGSPHRAVAAAAPAPPPSPSLPPSPPPPPPPPPKTLVATATVPSVDVYETPALAAGGRAWASFDNPTSMEVPLVFRVVASQGDALRVMLPTRPNGATGWIKGSDVSLAEDQFRAQVQLGAHQLTVWNGNDVIEQTTVAVGTPSAPTPTGDFYLTELIDTHNPGGAYGPYAFGLSAYSDVYTEFAGGPGQIGMHGTNAPGALGTDASHGCIRVENDVITKLASELPVGSQIVVTP